MSKTQQTPQVYDFGPFRLNAKEGTLLRDGELVKLTPKVIDTLRVLVERNGRIVAKDDLMEAVWPGTFVEESNLASNVSLLRKALGENADGKPYIETLAKRGYCFRAEVTEVEDAAAGLIVRRRTRARIVTHEEEFPGASPEELVAESVIASPIADNFNRAAPAVVPRTARVGRRGRVMAIMLIVLATMGVAFGLYRLIQYRSTGRLAHAFASTKVARVTTSGKATIAAISPDGKYVVQVLGGQGKQSLWLRHIATESDKEIVPSNGDDFSFVSFSRDGGHIFYVRFEAGVFPLYSVPILGGLPKKVIAHDVDTPITFAPDGQRFAFIRGETQKGEVSLVVASADGLGEQKLVTHKPGEFHQSWPWPSWSPDGEAIAFAHRSADAALTIINVFTVSARDGTEKQITFQKWSAIGALSWLADGSGLIVTAADEESGSAQQLWHVAYPSGEVRRITNDTNNYRGLSLTADSSALVTIQTEQSSNIWTIPGGQSGSAAQLTSTRSEGSIGISWTADGRIVYAAGKGRHKDIWIMNGDGTNQRQLTAEAGSNVGPSVSPDSRSIFFSSSRLGKYNIWRMDIDGANPRQLTHGTDDQNPDCSRDGHWVVYSASEPDKQRVMEVSVDGGDPLPVTNYTSTAPRVSPDGKMIVAAYVNEQENPPRWRLATISFGGGPPLQTFDISGLLAKFQWAADGKSLLYTVTRNGISNIWSQPLPGGPPKQLTDFNSEQIFRFDWSHDARHLVVARGSVVSDAVLINSK